MAGHDLPRSLLLPVETTNREFDGKLLLALKALERGYEPIIGSRTAMHAVLPSLPKSIYLAKGARSGSARVFSLLEALGHVIVALDEETLVRFPDDAFHMKLDPKTFNTPRLLFAWGKGNADVWRRFKDYGGAPIVESGNPRADLLRRDVRGFYDDDVRKIRQRYGSFILVSSNFAFVNHFIPNLTRHKVASHADREEAEKLKSGFYQHKQALFHSFLDAIPKLAEAAHPNRLVIRPHPSENQQPWLDATRGLANVDVIYEGPMVPWLMAAKGLVHNGCTSAIEAALLGTAAIAYQPVVSARYDLHLPNMLSATCNSINDVTAACRMMIEDPVNSFSLSNAQRTLLEENISSIDGKLSCDRILDAFAEYVDILAEGRSGDFIGWLSHIGKSLCHRRCSASKETNSHERE